MDAVSDGPAATEDGDDAAPDEEPAREEGTDHLADLPDGSGCTRVWETLAERRADDEETEAD